MNKLLIVAITALCFLSCNNASEGKTSSDSTIIPADSTSSMDTIINTDSLNNYDGNRM